MIERFPRGGIVALFAANVFAGFTLRASAETPVEFSSEARFQLDLHVPDAVIKALLPPGWTTNVAAQGPAKDANLRAVFIDRVTINGPDGKPVGRGSNRLVYLVAPVKDATGANVQLVIGGLTEEPADAPGPFGVYLLATTHTMQRSTSSGTARCSIRRTGYSRPPPANTSSCISNMSGAWRTRPIPPIPSSTPPRIRASIKSRGRSR